MSRFRVLLFLIPFLTCFLFFACSRNENEIEPRPAHQWKTLADGAWCWFSDPRAIYYKGEKEQTYIDWVDTVGSIMIASYDHRSGDIEKFTLHEKLQRDDHNVPSILVRSDRRLLVFYSKHGGDEFFMRLSKNPESIAEWHPVRTLPLNNNELYADSLLRDYTYSHPFQLSTENNRIYLFWRGINRKPCVSVSEDGGENWSKGKIIIRPEDIYQHRRPYVKYYSNNRDKIYFAFTDGHPRKEPENSIYYACYQQGSFYRADGSKITDFAKIPFKPRDADVVYDARATEVRAWVWDIATDQKGRPVILYTRLPEFKDHRYHYAIWDGEKWLDHEIVKGGGWFPQTLPGKRESERHYSAGLILDRADPSVVYLARPVNGTFEIERWQTSDMGKSWQSTLVTRQSEYDNVRPFISWNAPQYIKPRLFWMTNLNYIHYSDYASLIKMDIPLAP